MCSCHRCSGCEDLVDSIPGQEDASFVLQECAETEEDYLSLVDFKYLVLLVQQA